MPDTFTTISADDWRRSFARVRQEKVRIKPQIEKLMCDIDDADCVTVYNTKVRTAAKDHTCEETRLPIRKGEKYYYVSYAGDGTGGDHKECWIFGTWKENYEKARHEAVASGKWNVPKGSSLPFWPPSRFLLGECLWGLADYLRENAEEPAGTPWLDFARDQFDGLMCQMDGAQLPTCPPTARAVGLLHATSFRKRARREPATHTLIYQDVPLQPNRLVRAYRWAYGFFGVSVTPVEHPEDPEEFGAPLLHWYTNHYEEPRAGWADNLALDRSVDAARILRIAADNMGGVGNFKTAVLK